MTAILDYLAFFLLTKTGVPNGPISRWAINRFVDAVARGW